MQNVACPLLMFVAIFFALHTGAFSLCTSTVDASIPTEFISVSQGDTLWSIAAEHPIEGMTTQQCVRWISSTNDLDGCVLVPGQAIEVPGSASL